MTVDSYKWLPYSLGSWIRKHWELPNEVESVPFTPLKRPIPRARFAPITTGGLYLKNSQDPFNIERESIEPSWGDPTYRIIPRDAKQSDIGISHLHYNHEDVEQDFNILLPISRLLEMEATGEIGSLAPTSYSVMGYQGHPGPRWESWENIYGPMMLAKMQSEEVDTVLLTPA